VRRNETCVFEYFKADLPWIIREERRESEKARKHSVGIQKCMGKSLKVHKKFNAACIIDEHPKMLGGV
jgi:hypothetical protein